MRVESLSAGNLRRAVFCAQGEAGERMLLRLEKWLQDGVLRGQVVWSDEGEVNGFVLYYPIATSPMEMEGEDFYAIQCLFVQPGRGRQGIGRALIEAAAQDARERRVNGLAVEGMSFPPDESGFEFMPKAFFMEMGFEEVASQGPGSLLFLPLRAGATPPSYPKGAFLPPSGTDKLRIDLLNCDRCWVGIANCDIVRGVAQEHADQVEVHEHDQNSRDAVLEKGMAIGIFLDGQLAFFGPPITEEQAKEEIERRLAQRSVH